MKNKLSKIVLSALIISGSLMAESTPSVFTFDDVNSYIGIEGGVSNLGMEGNEAGVPANLQDRDLYHGGVKIGAQSDNYRVYLNANYYAGEDDFDYLTTYGAGIQYLLNFSKVMNAFIGVSAGMTSGKYYVEGETTTRTLSDPYIGAEAGLTVDLGDSVDLELGARVLSLDASNTREDLKITLDNMVTGYASINFKWVMN